MTATATTATHIVDCAVELTEPGCVLLSGVVLLPDSHTTTMNAGGLDAYVVAPSKPATAAVVLVTDIFGYKTDGIRKWADRLADAVSCSYNEESAV